MHPLLSAIRLCGARIDSCPINKKISNTRMDLLSIVLVVTMTDGFRLVLFLLPVLSTSTYVRARPTTLANKGNGNKSTSLHIHSTASASSSTTVLPTKNKTSQQHVGLCGASRRFRDRAVDLRRVSGVCRVGHSAGLEPQQRKRIRARRFDAVRSAPNLRAAVLHGVCWRQQQDCELFWD